MKKLPTTSLLLSGLFLSGLAATTAHAQTNPFALVELDHGYMQLAEADQHTQGNQDSEHKNREHERREHEQKDHQQPAPPAPHKEDDKRKQGEGKCGADHEKKSREGQCGADHERKSREGKCGSRQEHKNRRHHRQ